MPNDVKLGRALAAYIATKYVGKIHEVRFTYDSFIEIERMNVGSCYCIITPNNYSTERESRTSWRERCSLELSLLSHAGPTDDEQWIDDWLTSWDLLLEEVKTARLFGRTLPSSVDQDERYDADLFHNNRRLLCQATLHYLNVGVI